MTAYRKKLIEVALPLEAINVASGREKSLRHGHPSTLHLWWARRPLAAARAVLFAQLVDDPSSWPDLFPSEDVQNQERQRLFRLIEDLVQWENSNNPAVVNAARLEIARSHARASSSAKAKAILGEGVKPREVDAYLASELPAVHDPFAGGGTIPLEAQRLGLRSIATDLNPVAVVINRALVEIPALYQGQRPINSASRAAGRLQGWTGAAGLAEDVRYYGAWLRKKAMQTVGHLYPLVTQSGGRPTTVIAWLWARTVESPNPAFRGCHVPLVSTFWLSTKPGKETWVDPVVEGKTFRFEIRRGTPANRDAIGDGTKLGRGANFRCILSGAPIEPDYIKAEGMAGRMGVRMMAIVAEGQGSRTYLPPDAAQEQAAAAAHAEWLPETQLPGNRQYCNPPIYGMDTFGDLFLPRQAATLDALYSLSNELREQVERDARAASHSSPQEYAKAIALYLLLATDKCAEALSTLCTWSAAPKNELVVSTFRRQALPITWDFAEANPFATSSGSIEKAIAYVVKVVESLAVMPVLSGTVESRDARTGCSRSAILSTDPPYFNNVPYAALSDYFYSWMRSAGKALYPNEFSTVATPKNAELVADPERQGGATEAERFFMEGMSAFLEASASAATPAYPTTIYYAFRQSEADSASAVSSTGWDSFLQAVVGSKWRVCGTWPIRSERAGRMRDVGSNALASSIVLVCERQADDAVAATRGEFRRMLRKELPDALKKLQQANIAPVDVAQASIGPGMAIFSRHKHVLEADGSTMTVRGALQLINEVLDEYLASGEGDFDADTRFAITWYEQHGWSAGPFGEAETLAKARNVSVSGVVEAGICHSGAGKVRILKRPEMRPLDYDPAADERPTIWEFTQHMIRVLEDEGEEAAARLLKKLGSASDATRELAYRLYNTCERKKWAEDARSYNGLILAWPELEKLAAKAGDEPPQAAPSKPGKKGTKAKKTAKGQARLFEGDDDE